MYKACLRWSENLKSLQRGLNQVQSHIVWMVSVTRYLKVASVDMALAMQLVGRPYFPKTGAGVRSI